MSKWSRSDPPWEGTYLPGAMRPGLMFALTIYSCCAGRVHTSEIAHEDREVAWCGAAACARVEGADHRKHDQDPPGDVALLPTPCLHEPDCSHKCKKTGRSVTTAGTAPGAWCSSSSRGGEWVAGPWHSPRWPACWCWWLPSLCPCTRGAPR